jgi:hypothetical protein
MSHDPHHHHQHVHETAPLHDPVDEWHDHSKDEKPQQAHAEVGNAKLITGIGLALFLVIVASVIAVYAYYVWFITARLSKAEIASGQASPAIEARAYREQALIRIDRGGSVSAEQAGGAAAGAYTLAPINQAIEQTARTYTAR